MNLAATYSTNPYLIFNVVSPNNGGALGKADGARPSRTGSSAAR